ncbi:MAG: DUF4097 family beta strand repeat-containing protein [Anaerolineae bacterium]
MRRNTWIVLVAALLALLLLCCCATGLGLAIGGALSVPDLSLGRATDTYTQRVDVSGPVTLVVRNLVGDVSISPGPDGSVSVTADVETHARSRDAAQELLRQISVTVTVSGSEVNVEVTVPGELGSRSAGVDLVIAVPVQTSLQVRNDVGDLRVEDIIGAANLRNNVGDVSLSGVTLTGDSDIGVDVGEVNFSGSLPASGRVSITTRIGEVAVSLPAEAQFRLDAQTEVGDITCDFDLADRSEEEQGIVGHRLRGSVGEDPAVELLLSTTAGEIRLGRR